MDDSAPHRLKVKIGVHEFEAEGSADIVQAQFEAFKKIIMSTPAASTTLVGAHIPSGATPFPPSVHQVPPSSPVENGIAAVDSALEKIMKVDGRIVSLTVPPNSVEDAALLLLYGQKVLRKTETVTGNELLEGLKATGGLDFVRADRIMQKASGHVVATGNRRAKRYRLTNSGSARARQVASDLIAVVA